MELIAQKTFFILNFVLFEACIRIYMPINWSYIYYILAPLVVLV